MSKTALLACALAGPLWAQDARVIVEEAQRRSRADSERYEGTLEVVDARGRRNLKRWIYQRLGSHGNSKAVIRFTEPPEVRGVALLILNHPERASDQWMWTPATQRERRIAIQDRSTRFFGTDFSFEDLEERDVNQYDYRMIGEEAVEGAPCWKIESRPRKTRASQYSHSLLWIRKENYTFARIENYVRQELVRRATYREVQNVQGIWTPRLIEMHDLRRNSRTLLRLEKLQYNVPLKESEFTLQALRRGS